MGFLNWYYNIQIFGYIILYSVNFFAFYLYIKETIMGLLGAANWSGIFPKRTSKETIIVLLLSMSADKVFAFFSFYASKKTFLMEL